MKKLKLNLQQFEGVEVLTRSQLKKVLGGGGGDGTGSGGGQCYVVNSGSNTSCWYATSGNADTLCDRVYPNSEDPCITSSYNGTGECGPTCHMN